MTFMNRNKDDTEARRTVRQETDDAMAHLEDTKFGHKKAPILAELRKIRLLRLGACIYMSLRDLRRARRGKERSTVSLDAGNTKQPVIQGNSMRAGDKNLGLFT